VIVQNEVYFVNYGRKEDYDVIDRNGINITGKIVICKYGFAFRGDKVQLYYKYGTNCSSFLINFVSKIMSAQSRGAIGILLYDDPKSVFLFFLTVFVHCSQKSLLI
jgi:hypothetical protein